MPRKNKLKQNTKTMPTPKKIKKQQIYLDNIKYEHSKLLSMLIDINFKDNIRVKAKQCIMDIISSKLKGNEDISGILMDILNKINICIKKITENQQKYSSQNIPPKLYVSYTKKVPILSEYLNLILNLIDLKQNYINTKILGYINNIYLLFYVLNIEMNGNKSVAINEDKYLCLLLIKRILIQNKNKFDELYDDNLVVNILNQRFFFHSINEDNNDIMNTHNKNLIDIVFIILNAFMKEDYCVEGILIECEKKIDWIVNIISTYVVTKNNWGINEGNIVKFVDNLISLDMDYIIKEKLKKKLIRKILSIQIKKINRYNFIKLIGILIEDECDLFTFNKCQGWKILDQYLMIYGRTTNFEFANSVSNYLKKIHDILGGNPKICVKLHYYNAIIAPDIYRYKKALMGYLVMFYTSFGNNNDCYYNFMNLLLKLSYQPYRHKMIYTTFFQVLIVIYCKILRVR